MNSLIYSELLLCKLGIKTFLRQLDYVTQLTRLHDFYVLGR